MVGRRHARHGPHLPHAQPHSGHAITRSGPLGSVLPRVRWPRVPEPLTTPEYPLPPQGGMQIFVRAYAPFEHFGGGYRGDNRVASTDTRATARIKWVFAFDVATMRQVEPAAPSSDQSHGDTLLTGVLAYTVPFSGRYVHDPVTGRESVTAQATPSNTQATVPVGRPGQGFALTGTLAGANPLIAGSPDIDVQVNLKVKKRDGRLEFSGSLMGDAFPNAEVFVRDAAGDAMMLHTFETAGDSESGPMVYLPGDNRRPMGTFARSVLVSSIGLLDE
jgi:hypothetical protein